MAIDRLDLLTGSFLPVVSKELTNQWYRADPLVAKTFLSSRGKAKSIRGGSVWYWPYSHSGVTEQTEYTDPYQVFVFGSKQTAGLVKTSPVHLEANVSLADLEVDWQQGDAAIIDMKDQKKTALKEGFQVTLAKKFWGTVASDINSIPDVMAVDTAFMNLTPSDVAGAAFHPTDAARSLWNPQADAATTDLSDHAILNFIKKISEGYSDRRPSLIVSNPETHQAFMSLHQGQVWYQDQEMLDIGFDDQISVGKVPWFSSIFCAGSGAGTANNHIVFLNTKKSYWINMAGRELSTKAYRMEPEQETVVFQTKMSGNVVYLERQLQGRMTTIDPTIV